MNGQEKIRALVADDHPGNRRIISALLEAVDVEVEVVADGALAVERARSGVFDVAFIDRTMPVLDGLQAVRLIRADERRKRAEPLPIFLISAQADEATRRAGRRAGADGHIAKPICVRRFLEAVGAGRRRFEARTVNAAPAGV